MKKILFALFFIAVNFMSVAQGPLVAGKVIDTIRCQSNEKQSYALYLPKNYSRATSWPVIFFYDPSARGNFPVKLYSALAEKYQCILVGSNNSRNGPFNVTQEAEQAILKDVESRFSIAKNRLFISGFSGGARASVYLAMQRKIYAGIIACGAAFPFNRQLATRDNIPFIETVGNVDFNLVEAVETNDYLNKIKYPHSLIFFQGTHSWPPATVYDHAILWQIFRLQLPGKSLIESYEESLLTQANFEINSGELYMAYWNINHFVLSTRKIDSLQISIFNNPLLKKEQKKFATALETEKDLLREFYRLYEKINYVTHDSTFNESEWKGLFTKINKFKKSEDILEAQMYERVLQQIQIGCVGGYQGEIGLKRYLQASLKARVLILLQPDYQSYVLLARAYARMNRKKEAIQALSKSAELGLSDTAVINGNDFSTLAGEKKFIAVKQQIELNAKKVWSLVIGHLGSNYQ